MAPEHDTYDIIRVHPGPMSVSEALDYEEATGRKYNWVRSGTRDPVVIGRAGGPNLTR